MKNNRIVRRFVGLLAALVLVGGFSVTAYAGGGPEFEEPPQPIETIEPQETTGGYDPQPLTPQGNMSLVDDISGEASGDKQFITVVSRNGYYFYIIIDRAEDGENTVHFLNQVDEADLLQLMEDGGEAPAPVCNCTDKCIAGNVKTSCPVCSVNMGECAGMAAAEPEPADEPEKENSGSVGGILLVVLLLAGAGGVFYYFKIRKPKQNTAQGGLNLDDLPFDGDEETEEEPVHPIGGYDNTDTEDEEM